MSSAEEVRKKEGIVNCAQKKGRRGCCEKEEREGRKQGDEICWRGYRKSLGFEG